MCEIGLHVFCIYSFVAMHLVNKYSSRGDIMMLVNKDNSLFLVEIILQCNNTKFGVVFVHFLVFWFTPSILNISNHFTRLIFNGPKVTMKYFFILWIVLWMHQMGPHGSRPLSLVVSTSSKDSLRAGRQWPGFNRRD